MKRQKLLPFLLLIQIILIPFLGYFPDEVERFYSKGCYPFISKSLRMVFGNFPYSVGDVLYFLLIVFGIQWVWTNRKSWKTHWKNNMLKIVSCFSVIYFAFHLLWGFNYYRQPLFKTRKIELEYTDSDLSVFTKKVRFKTNAA